MGAQATPLAAREPSGRAAAIYRSIFEAVVDQRLSPGAKLVEEQLGAMFGASRTLVRSALQALAHDHIVTLERHRGAFVSAPTVADARDVFFSRRLVESGIALEVARKIQSEDIASLRTALADEAAAIRRNDRQSTIRLSGALHMAIARIGGEGALTRFLGGLISRSSLVIALYGRGTAPSCARDEHSKIVDALAARDGAGAAALMAEHLEHILAGLVLEIRPEDRAIDLASVLRAPIAAP